MKKVSAAFTAAMMISVFFLSSLAAEEGVQFSFYPGERFILTEKQDLRMRENGRYKGFIYRELRSSLREEGSRAGGTVYKGTSYLFQEMKRDAVLLGRRLEESGRCEITLSPDGAYRVPHDQLFPLLRSVPSFPSEPVVAGDRWRVYGERMVRAREGARYTRVPVYIEYRYDGVKGDGPDAYHALYAQYALRYRGEDPSGDPNLQAASGSHKVDIRIPVDNPARIFMRDIVEEQYQLRGGTQISYSGAILTWFDSPVEYDRHEILNRLAEKAGIDEKPEEDLVEDAEETAIAEGGDGDLPPLRAPLDAGEVVELDLDEGGIVISEGEEGLTLSLPEIHFVPDSARILPDEAPRLDIIAHTLAGVEGVTFLIRGHTADVGSPESQMTLSFERAKAILDELAARGIPASRMIYEGKGGTQPVAPNDTEEGRRRNRRVEIILLE